MVAAVVLGIDEAVLDPLAEAVGAEEIVDSPPGVLFPCVEHIAPPAVGVAPVRIEDPEGVGKAGGKKLGHLSPLLVGEAGVAPVRLVVLEVDFLVGDVHIAADNDGLFLIEGAKVLSKAVFPVHSVVKALKVPPGVGGIYVNEVKIRVLKGYYPSLVVVALNVDSVENVQGLVFRKNRRSGIALLLGAVPELVVARKLQVNLVGLELRLLEAEKIRVHFVKALHKSFSHTGAQPVHVPGYELHRRFSFLISRDRVFSFCTAGRR